MDTLFKVVCFSRDYIMSNHFLDKLLYNAVNIVSQNDRIKLSDSTKPFSKILMVDPSYFHLISNQNREKQMEWAN